MALNLLYGGGKVAQIYQVNGTYTTVTKKDGSTAVGTSYAASDAMLTIGGDNAPLVSAEVTWDSSNVPSLTIVTKTVGTDLDLFIESLSPRKSGGTSAVTFETGFDAEGNAWGSTAGSSFTPLAIVLYSAKITGTPKTRNVDVYLMSLDPTSAGFKFEGGKAVECQLKFKGIPCKIASGSLAVPTGVFSTEMVSSATAMTIAKDYYKATTTSMTAA